MVTVINGPQSRSAMLGSALGQGFGGGLSSGIGSLLENKLAQLQQAQQSQKAYDFGIGQGWSPQQAKAYSMLGPKGWERIGPELFLGAQYEQPTRSNMGFNQQEPQYNPQQVQQLLGLLGQSGQQQNAFTALEELQQPRTPQEQLQQALLGRMGIKTGAPNRPQNTETQQQLGQLAQQLQGGMEQNQEAQQLPLPGQQHNAVNRAPEGETTLQRQARIGKEALNPQLQISRQRAEQGEEANKIRRENQEIKIQGQLRPIVQEYSKKYENQIMSRNLAQRMLSNLEKNREKWPGFIKGKTPSALISDSDFKTYISDGAELVKLTAESGSGVTTDAKLELAKLTKPSLDLPIETQENILKKIIRRGDVAEGGENFIKRVTDENQGNYPKNIREQLQERENASENPLKYPHLFMEGTTYTHDNGENYVLKNKKWKKA